MPNEANPNLSQGSLEASLDHLFQAKKPGKRLSGFKAAVEEEPTSLRVLGPEKLQNFLADCGVTPRTLLQMKDHEAIKVATLVLGDDSMPEPVRVHRMKHEGTNVVFVTVGYSGEFTKPEHLGNVEAAGSGTADWVEIDGDLSVRERWNTALSLFYVYDYIRGQGLLPESEVAALIEMRK